MLLGYMDYGHQLIGLIIWVMLPKLPYCYGRLIGGKVDWTIRVVRLVGSDFDAGLGIWGLDSRSGTTMLEFL